MVVIISNNKLVDSWGEGFLALELPWGLQFQVFTAPQPWTAAVVQSLEATVKVPTHGGVSVRGRGKKPGSISRLWFRGLQAV